MHLQACVHTHAYIVLYLFSFTAIFWRFFLISTNRATTFFLNNCLVFLWTYYNLCSLSSIDRSLSCFWYFATAVMLQYKSVVSLNISRSFLTTAFNISLQTSWFEGPKNSSHCCFTNQRDLSWMKVLVIICNRPLSALWQTVESLPYISDQNWYILYWLKPRHLLKSFFGERLSLFFFMPHVLLGQEWGLVFSGSFCHFQATTRSSHNPFSHTPSLFQLDPSISITLMHSLKTLVLTS